MLTGHSYYIYCNNAWDDRDKYRMMVNSGVYFYRLESDNFFQVRKMIYIR